MEICFRTFGELSTDELYEILRLRSEVFVVEQNCVYQDVDGRDKSAVHVFFKNEEGILGCLRVLDRGVAFDDVSIGRVVVAKRRCGLGTRLLEAGILVARKHFRAERIVLEAQTYARGLYEKQGFVQTSEEFLEDGIPHIRMTLEIDKTEE